MFSGIVEAKSRVLDFALKNFALAHLSIQKPPHFDDINIGDSIAVNGICLTVESIENDRLQFAVGAETLKVTGWSEGELKNAEVNLERSLRWGDRVHGHMVTGHVDGVGEVVSVQPLADSASSVLLEVKIPKNLKSFVFRKGCIALNGVSLTINDVQGDRVAVCLIPETLKRTNLGTLKPGQKLNIEVDQYVRAIQRLRESEL